MESNGLSDHVHFILLLLSTITFSACSMPPKGQREDISGGYFLRKKLIRMLLRSIFPITQLFLGIAEVSLIIGSHYLSPASQLSRIIHSFLLSNGGNASNIRLTPLRTIGMGFMLLGSFIRIRSINALGRLFTPQSDMQIQKDHKLITMFPYSIVRHPAYSATMLSHAGCFMCSFTKGAWAIESGVMGAGVRGTFLWVYAASVALFPLMVLRKMWDEDQTMRIQFGREWEEWAQNVKYLVVPWVV